MDYEARGAGVGDAQVLGDGLDLALHLANLLVVHGERVAKQRARVLQPAHVLIAPPRQLHVRTRLAEPVVVALQLPRRAALLPAPSSEEAPMGAVEFP